MAELTARTPCAGLLPVTHGSVTLAEVDVGVITSIAPFRGQAGALAKGLRATHGLDWPAPGQMTRGAGVICVWTGKDQAFLMGVVADAGLQAHAALTDQSDAWAVVQISGAGAEAVLARLVPLDLRVSAFAIGQTARSLLQHMTVSVTRVGPEAFQIMAFRSMAATLVHDITTAMAGVAARGSSD